MIQNIIVVLVVAAAAVYAGYSVYRSLRPENKPKSACGGCTGCELKNMKIDCRDTPPNTFSGKALTPYPNRQMKSGEDKNQQH